jgi:hypothetical protein
MRRGAIRAADRQAASTGHLSPSDGHDHGDDETIGHGVATRDVA